MLLLQFYSAFATQTRFPNYESSRKVFWSELYPNGGVTLYCALNFAIPSQAERRFRNLSVEHVLPADWMADHFGCSNRNNCDDSSYGFSEADLHNLWPAHRRINASRSDLPFTELKSDVGSRFEYCPEFDRTYGTDAAIEPRDPIKGDVARSLFYMNYHYGFDLRGMLPILKIWNQQDQPDQHEHWRNQRIFELQGSRNRFIDNYRYGNAL